MALVLSLHLCDTVDLFFFKVQGTKLALFTRRWERRDGINMNMLRLELPTLILKSRSLEKICLPDLLQTLLKKKQLLAGLVRKHAHSVNTCPEPTASAIPHGR